MYYIIHRNHLCEQNPCIVIKFHRDIFLNHGLELLSDLSIEYPKLGGDILYFVHKKIEGVSQDILNFCYICGE